MKRDSELKALWWFVKQTVFTGVLFYLMWSPDMPGWVHNLVWFAMWMALGIGLICLGLSLAMVDGRPASENKVNEGVDTWLEYRTGWRRPVSLFLAWMWIAVAAALGWYTIAVLRCVIMLGVTLAVSYRRDKLKGAV